MSPVKGHGESVCYNEPIAPAIGQQVQGMIITLP